MKKSSIIYGVLVSLLLICAIVIPKAFAVDDVPIIDNTVVLWSYDEIYTISKSDYVSIDCSGGTYYNATMNGNGDIVIKLNGTIPSSSGTDSITCNATQVDDSNNTIDVVLKYTINYSAEAPVFSSNINTQLSRSNPTFNVYEGMSGITTTDVTLNGANISVNCPINGNTCTVTATNFTGNSSYSGTVSYTDAGGNKHEVTIGIYIFSGKVYLNGGNYGSCNFADTGFTVDSNYPSLYSKDASESMTLPTCTADNSKFFLLEFAGWTPSTLSDVQSTKVSVKDTTVGTCMNASGFVPAGSSATGAGEYYSSCYKYLDGFELIPSGGTVELSELDYRNISGSIMVKGSDIFLPAVTAPEGFNFIGWYDADTNEKFNAGDSVSTNSSSYPRRFVARYSKKAGVDSHSYTTAMTVNQTETLSKLINNGVEFSSCSSSDSSLVEVTRSSECILTSNTKTGSTTVTAKVVVDGETTDTYIINVTVYEAANLSADFINDGLIIDGDTEVEWEDYYGEISQPDSTIGSATSCDYYYVWAEGDKTSQAVSGLHRFNIYKARPSADGCDKSKVYNALCLDPGLRGPNETYGGVAGNYYKKSETLNPFTGTKSRDSALYYLVSQIANDGENHEKYAAVNFVGRVIQYMYGWNNNSSSANIYSDQNNAYKAIAAANSLNSTEFKLPSGYSFLNYSSTIKEYYAGAVSAVYSAASESDHTITVENEESTHEWVGTTFIAHRKGTLVMPEGTTGITSSSLIPNCSLSGYTCTVNSFTQQGSSNKWDFDVQVSINLDNTSLADLPDVEDESLSFKLDFPNGTALGSAFVITHQSYANVYQRLLLINPSDNEYLMYVNLKISASCNLDADLLNYRTHCTETGCDDIIRMDYFKALGCCSQIEDKTSAVFEYLCAGGDCAYSTMLPTCEYKATASDENDLFNIDEATDSFGNERYQCVVDVGSKANTTTLTDAVGNNFALGSYSSNRYCRVSCKEDWYISTSSFGNFTGDNAVLAGSYFQIENDVFIGGSRTCVTTYIDTDLYEEEIRDLASQLVDAWNKYSEFTALYDALDKAQIKESEKNYYSSSYTGTCTCCSYDEDGNWNCPECGTYTGYNLDGTCKEYKLYTSGHSDIYYKYSELYNTENASYRDTVGSNHSELINTETSNTTVGSSGGNCYNGSAGRCGTKTGENLRSEAKSIISGQIDEYRSKVANLQETIESYSNDMADCQNFELYTISDYNEFKDSSSIVQAYGNGVIYKSTYVSNNGNATKIETEFSPYVEYSYDEELYMDYLDKDNYMVPYTAANNIYFGGSTDRTVSRNTDEYTSVDNACSSESIGTAVSASGSKNIYLCRHYYKTYGYKGDASTDENAVYGVSGSPSTTGSKSLGSSTSNFTKLTLCKTASGNTKVNSASDYCSVATFYYYDVNFVKQTIENSSFWKNKGNWYVNSHSDEKAHGDTLSEAARASYLTVKTSEDFFSIEGGDNVFPISMETRRNLYQYVYTFYNIGQYNDGKLGRIMGGEKHALDNRSDLNSTVLGYNYHSCFYEVYESICRCCGQPITTTTVTSTTQYIQDNGDFYDESDHDDDPSDSTLALFTNVVGLSNLASASNRVLGANWSAQTPFYYNGARYCSDDASCNQGGTNQGVELIAQIESIGDEIYDEIPEYSFTLDPSALSEIRDYNKSHSYAIEVDDLTNYGKTAFVAHGSSGYAVKDSEEDYKINFNHFGSKFLENLRDEGYVTKEFRGKTLVDLTGSNVCSVDEGSVDSIFTSSSYANCRWIDYISNNKDEDGNAVQIRLAFK